MYSLEYLPVAKRDMTQIVHCISRELGNPDAAESVLTFPYACPAYVPIRPLNIKNEDKNE